MNYLYSLIVGMIFLSFNLKTNEFSSLINCEEKDSIEIYLRHYYENDTVKLMINGDVVYSSVITTDDLSGFADIFTNKKPKGKSFNLQIKVNACLSPIFIIKRKYNFIELKFHKRECQYEIEPSRTMIKYAG